MGFNQDASCVSIGTKSGYRIFNCQPFGRNIFSTEGGIGIVEMLFCTSLVALVGGGDYPAFSPCRLKLWNTKTASVICELNFESEIQAVKMNRKRLIVVLEAKLHVYDLDSMVNLQTLEISTLGARQSTGSTSPEAARLRCASSSSSSSLLTSPLCELSPDDSNSFLALPANSVCGDIFLYDALNLVEFRWINAHKAPLTALKFSLDGTMLATASETGTVIRIFRVPSGEKLFSFRRGTYSATVFSLSFNETSSMLAASSSNGTVHVFSLGEGHAGSGSNVASGDENSASATSSVASGSVIPPGTHPSDGTSELGGEQKPPGSLFGYAASNAMALLEHRPSFSGMFLPGAISDLVEPCRSFAIARLKNNSVITACALAKHLLCVVTSEGHFYQYSVSKGGCQLVFEMSLHVSDAASGKEEDGYTRFFKFSSEHEDTTGQTEETTALTNASSEEPGSSGQPDVSSQDT